MADRLPTRPPRTNWGNLSKNLALWLLVGLLALALFQMMSRQRNPTQEFSYTEFSHQLDQGNVARVEVYDGKRLEGDFKNPVTQDGRTAKSFQVLLPVANSEEFIKRLEDAGVPILAKEPKGGITAIIIAALPWIVILGLWFFLLRQLQAGGSRAFAFGKSKAKLLAGDTPKITFADVAGADEAKVELQEIIEFLKDPQKFTRLGGRLPKGALLVGPPGTGKTLLAKAVAGEAGRPFFSMSGSDFVEMFVGVGASRVRDLFEQGKTHAPCIIFIDEIDAVGRHRGAGLGGGHDEREQTLNQLLVEMDGFESNDGVILIAATNRPDVLDPALLRPGRFDRQIVVDAPDVRGREGILRVHTRKIPLAADVRLEVIAQGHARHGRRRPRQPGERGGGARGPAQQDAGGHAGLRGRQGQGHARRRAPEPGAHRGGAEAHRLPRGGTRDRRDQDPGQRSDPQGHDRAARPRARSHRVAARGRPAQLHQGLAHRQPRHVLRRPGGRGDRLRRRQGHHRRGERHRAGHRPRPPHGHPVRHERAHRPARRGRQGAGDLPRPRVRPAAGDLRAHRADGGRRGEAPDRRGLRPGHRRFWRRTASCSTASPRRCSSARRSTARTSTGWSKNLPLPPRTLPPADSPAPQASAPTKPGASPARAPILGAPPAEPAGA